MLEIDAHETRVRVLRRDPLQVQHDDVLVAQWPLFNALSHVPLMMMRTQLTEQLPHPVSVGAVYVAERHDTPDAPNAYGFGGWMEGAKALVYDRYDGWELDPEGEEPRQDPEPGDRTGSARPFSAKPLSRSRHESQWPQAVPSSAGS